MPSTQPLKIVQTLLQAPTLLVLALTPMLMPSPAPAPPSGIRELVRVEGGTFWMGSLAKDTVAFDREKPRRLITLNTFYIGKYEVTQADWREIMGSDPPQLYNKGCDECPVEKVSWEEVAAFLVKLNQKYPGKNFRLPTEAEWEYAARGGNKSQGYPYAGGKNLDKLGWYVGNFEKAETYGTKKTTHPVGRLAPNELGIYDMSGNVAEWCSDWYQEDFYKLYSPLNNPQGPESGQRRVHRGGSWNFFARLSRVAYRYSAEPDSYQNDVGFRVVAASE